MKAVLRPTTENDAPEVVSFLTPLLQRESLRPDLLRWKLWAPRDDYAEPRSYVLERNGRIIAHAGIWPTTVRTVAGTVRGCHLFDWAADARALGAGVAIVQRICEMFDFIYAIGGAQITQKIIPAIGFKQAGDAWSGARPLRPLRQALSHQYKDWRMPARLVRNAMWSVIPTGMRPEGWEIQEGLDGGDGRSLSLDNLRSSGFLKYLQSCPTAQIRVFEIRKDDHNAGRFALSLLHNQVRIAGLWLNNPSPENLCVGYALAQQVARTMSDAFEITSTGSTPESERAAVAAGFRIRKHTPIYLLSFKTGPLPAAFDFQMADTDAVFQSAGEPCYWT
ncbi:MAG TPA: hypothetical protein VMB47_05810 [Candidatus Aquilonibacter sp.]|nr:hypothetical protein [Candidatus Aquilonibacter sp.]